MVVIAAALYPSGTGNPSTIGAPVRIYRGWPSEAQLDKDLANGVVNVSVYPRQGYTRNTTRYPLEWVDGPVTLPTMSFSISNNTVTITGPGGVSQNVGIRTDDGAWAVTAAPSDGPADVAAALRAFIPGSSGTGADVVMPTTEGLIARVGGFGVASQEVRRQQQGFQITIWAPTPALRDTAASEVDLILAQSSWLTLVDGSQVRLSYDTSTVVDEPSEANLWRRDLIYTVEYPTIARLTVAQMLFGGGLLEPGVVRPSEAFTVYGDVHPDVAAEVNIH